MRGVDQSSASLFSYVDLEEQVPPDHPLRALLLQAFYTFGSERQLMEQLDFNLLFRWFVGLAMDDAVWDRGYLDLVEPAHIAFEDNGHGEFAFGCVHGSLDCEYSRRIIFFTWQRLDEMDEVNGNGSTALEDDGSLEIEIRSHLGDEAILKAQRL